MRKVVQRKMRSIKLRSNDMMMPQVFVSTVQGAGRRACEDHRARLARRVSRRRHRIISGVTHIDRSPGARPEIRENTICHPQPSIWKTVKVVAKLTLASCISHSIDAVVSAVAVLSTRKPSAPLRCARISRLHLHIECGIKGRRRKGAF